jgi:hypothetical protein
MDHLSACLFPWNCRYWRVVWIFAGFGPFKYALTAAGFDSIAHHAWRPVHLAFTVSHHFGNSNSKLMTANRFGQ